MLFNNSPVKSISEKLKSPQASIKNLKFEREKDFKSFLKYIEREAKELDKIKLPPRNEIEKKSGGGLGALLGLGAIGLLSLFGGGKGGDGNQYAYGDRGSGNVFRMPPIGRDRKREDDSDEKRELDFDPKGPSRKNFLGLGLGQLNEQFARSQLLKANQLKAAQTRDFASESGSVTSFIEEEQFVRKKRKITTETEMGGGATGKKTSSSTSTIDDFINAEDPFNVKSSSNQSSTGGKGGGKGKSFNPNRDIPKAELSKLNRKISRLTNSLTNIETKKRLYGEITNTLRNAGASDEYISNFFRNILKLDESLLSKMPDPNEAFSGRKSKGSKPVKIKAQRNKSIFTKIGNFKKGIAADFSKPTLGINIMEDFISKVGLGKKTNLFGMNPKGMSIFKFSSFSKGKTGLMVLDFGLTAMELYDSLSKVRPRSNIGASLLDLVGINLNNFVADLMNNPSMLREYVSVTNDPRAINANKNREIINQNIRKIKELKKKNFTGDDITEGAIGTKQFINNLGKVLKNPNTYNPFAQVVPQPNSELFQPPAGDSSYDNILGIFQDSTLDGGG